MPRSGGGGGGGGRGGGPARKQAFSGKAKKEYLKAKRERKAAEGAAEWAEAERLRYPGAEEPAPAPRAGAMPERLTTSLGKSGRENQLSTIVLRESDEEIEARKLVSTAPVRMSRRGERAVAPVPSVDYASVDIPRSVMRSSAGAAVRGSGMAVSAAEHDFFRRWLRRVYGRFAPEQLSSFEHNVQVWQQLWRTVESATTVVLVADARNPLFHLPPSLLAFCCDEARKPVVVALTKTDLVPDDAVAAWSREIRRRFPGVRAVVATTAAASSAGSETRLSTRRRAIRASLRCYDAEHKSKRAQGALALLEEAGASEAQQAVVRAGVMLSSGTGRGGVTEALARAGITPTGERMEPKAKEAGTEKPKRRQRRKEKGEAAAAAAAAPAPGPADEGSSKARGKGGKKKKGGRRGRNAEYHDRLEAAGEAAEAGMTAASGPRPDAADVSAVRAAEVARLMAGDAAAVPAALRAGRSTVAEDDADRCVELIRRADWSDQPSVALGVIGHPNVGKSSIINALTGAKRVSVSRTPGHTKRMQHIGVCPGLTVLDCPGLLFPHCYGPAAGGGDEGAEMPDDALEAMIASRAERGGAETDNDDDDDDGDDSDDSDGDKDVGDDKDSRGKAGSDDDEESSDGSAGEVDSEDGDASVGHDEPPPPGAARGGAPDEPPPDWRSEMRRHRAMQECLGVVPLAQVREPYSAVRFLAERLPIEKMYGLRPVDDDDHAAAAAGTFAWSAFDLCEAYAVKSGLLYARTGRPDAHAAGRRVLQDAVDGVLPIFFWPPSHE